MLNHPTLEKLRERKLTGMKDALQEQHRVHDIQALDFEERLGLLVDREITVRAERRLKTRLMLDSENRPPSRTSTTAILVAWTKP